MILQVDAPKCNIGVELIWTPFDWGAHREDTRSMHYCIMFDSRNGKVVFLSKKRKASLQTWLEKGGNL